MNSKEDLAAVILAAGEGTRMKSDLAKVLHRIGGRSMIRRIVESVRELGPECIILIVGYQAEAVKGEFEGEDIRFALQRERLGTGHAVMQAKDVLKSFSGTVLILTGDTPFLTTRTLREFCHFHSANGNTATVMSTRMKDPSGYGRIVRGKGDRVDRIVEHADATAGEKQIDEINSGIFCVDSDQLFDALSLISKDNIQDEYYLTDIIEILNGSGGKTGVYVCEDSMEVTGINTRAQLEEAERLISDG
ncbi:MAG: NTP transferase domain-containing protein [Candidatus Latescibacteria bacterium]|nr:NTP transferase domain-containing protein [bacterium]MBD3423322.1 NTP transferase domain-containing protein [Candidatus Latescibacterota bacterium]